MNDCATDFDQDEFLNRLRELLGDEGLVTDPDAIVGYTTDWTGVFSGQALALARPTTTADVAAILTLSNGLGVTVLPQGGNTGLVGGSVPAPAHDGQNKPVIILSTQRLNQENRVDARTSQLRVGAGVTVTRVHEIAAEAGLAYGVDLASRDSATIGGTVATNAGGIRVCAFGMTRQQLVGLEVVLPGGERVEALNGLPKDNTGYDLVGLMCGSEGTLGVITQVLLQLQLAPGKSAVALLAVEDLPAALDLYRVASSQNRILAAEIMDRAGTEQVCLLADLPWPLDSKTAPYVMLLEWELDSGAQDLPSWIPEAADAVLGFDSADIARLWTYRERQSEAAQLLPDKAAGQKLIKLDVSIPRQVMGEFDNKLRALVAPENLSVFGHIGDGNLHIEIAATPEQTDSITLAVLTEVGTCGGSISGEHGVGRAKVKYLHLSRSGAEIATMRAIKSALDPKGTMAPGVILRQIS